MNKRILSSALLFVVVALLLIGCTPGELKTLEISPKVVYVLPGQTVELSVVGRDNFGTEITDLADLVWLVEGNVGTLSASNSLTPTLTGVTSLGAVGKVVVTSGELSAEATVEIVAEIPEPVAWVESFENYTTNAEGWQVVSDNKAPDGSKVLKYNGAGGTVNISLPIPAQAQVPHGRLEFSVLQTEGSASNFGIKPYPKGDGYIDFWISKAGEARLWRNVDPANPNDNYAHGQWHRFAFEWNLNAGTFTAFARVNGTWVQRWSTSGITTAPTSLDLDGGADGSGAIDDIQIFNLDLM